jgi:hypothetical protein
MMLVDAPLYRHCPRLLSVCSVISDGRRFYNYEDEDGALLEMPSRCIDRSSEGA